MYNLNHSKPHILHPKFWTSNISAFWIFISTKFRQKLNTRKEKSKEKSLKHFIANNPSFVLTWLGVRFISHLHQHCFLSGFPSNINMTSAFPLKIQTRKRKNVTIQKVSVHHFALIQQWIYKGRKSIKQYRDKMRNRIKWYYIKHWY